MRLGRAIVGVALGALVATGGAFAQDASAKDAKHVELRVTAKTGDTWRFRRSVERSVTCPQLAADAEDSVSQDYTAKVTAVGEDGAVSLEVAFGAATGKYKSSAETTLEFDSSKPLPESENPLDAVMMHSLSYLGGATVKVKLDVRGTITEATGVREALAKALAGTPFAAFADEMSDKEAREAVQTFLPPLPTEDHGPGTTWQDEQKVEYGARRSFKFQRTWTQGVPTDGKVAVSAKLLHVPLDTVPEGQTNSGEGEVTGHRSMKDGMLEARKVTANFTGKGNFDVDAKYTETIERLPVEDAR